jgi:hypothetical protein
MAQPTLCCAQEDAEEAAEQCLIWLQEHGAIVISSTGDAISAISLNATAANTDRSF